MRGHREGVPGRRHMGSRGPAGTASLGYLREEMGVVEDGERQGSGRRGWQSAGFGSNIVPNVDNIPLDPKFCPKA